MSEVWITAIWFLGYSLFHSMMSTDWLKKIVKRYDQHFFSLYRLLFVLVQTVAFVVMWIVIPKPSGIFWHVSGPAAIIMRILQGLSIAGLIVTVRQFSLKEFTGIAQLLRFIGSDSVETFDERYELHTNGMFGISRHPLYLFTFILFLFQPVMTIFGLLLLIWLGLYFYIGTFFEEKRLVRIFGESYIAYQKNVSRIFPWKWLLSNAKILKPLNFSWRRD